MKQNDRIDISGATLLILFAALVGFNQVLVKLVNAGIAPVFQAGLRSACAFLPVLLYALWAKKRLSIRDGSLIPGIFAGILFAGEFLFLFLGLDHTTVARASLFFYTMPCWVALGAHFLISGDRLTPIRVAGLGFAIGGVAIALLWNADTNTTNTLQGDVYCLVAAACWAGLTLVARTTKLRTAVPEMQLLYQLAVSAAILLPVAVWQGETFREMTPLIASLFAFQVLIVVAFGFVVWFWLLTIYPASGVASFGFLSPVFGLFFAWSILEEAIGINLIVALILIALGLVLVNRRVSAARVQTLAE